MGFTSELEELRGTFQADWTLAAPRSASPVPMIAGGNEPVLDDENKQLCQDFTEALDSSSRRSPNGPPDISYPQPHPRGRRESSRYGSRPRTDRRHRSHRRAPGPEAEAPIRIEPLPDIVATASRWNRFLQSDRQRAQYLKPGVPRHFHPGPDQAGFAISRSPTTPRHRSQGPSADFRSFSSRWYPGQARTGHRTCPCPALVRRLGGTMSVASELHSGSTFTITLPIKWTARNRTGIHEQTSQNHHIEDDEGHARLIDEISVAPASTTPSCRSQWYSCG